MQLLFHINRHIGANGPIAGSIFVVKRSYIEFNHSNNNTAYIVQL